MSSVRGQCVLVCVAHVLVCVRACVCRREGGCDAVPRACVRAIETQTAWSFTTLAESVKERLAWSPVRLKFERVFDVRACVRAIETAWSFTTLAE